MPKHLADAPKCALMRVMWTPQAIADWYAATPGWQVAALLQRAAETLAGVPWVGHERPDVLVTGAPAMARLWPTATVVNGWENAGVECRYDRMVLLHTVDMADDPASLLAHVVRVLRPDGRVVVIVPQRTSPWVWRAGFSPFGAGEPYTLGQLTQRLSAAGLTVVDSGTALYLPPLGGRWVWRWTGVWQQVMKGIPGSGGALLVVAHKTVGGAKGLRVSAEGKVRLQPVGVGL